MIPFASRARKLLQIFVPVLLAVAAAIGAGTPVRAESAAAGAPDSLAAPDTTQPALPPGAALRVYLEKGKVVPAIRVQLLGNGLLRITRPDGSREHVAGSRVWRIEDEQGRDLTQSVLGEGRSGAVGQPRAPEGVVRDWDAARFQARLELGYGTSKVAIEQTISDSGAIYAGRGESDVHEVHVSIGAGYRLGRGVGSVQPDLIAFGSLDPSIEAQGDYRNNLDAYGLVLQGGLEAGVRFRAGSAHHVRFLGSVAPGFALVRSLRYRTLYHAGDLRWTGRLGVEWESTRSPVSVGAGVRRLWRGSVETRFSYPTVSYRVITRYTTTDTQGYVLVRSKFGP